MRGAPVVEADSTPSSVVRSNSSSNRWVAEEAAHTGAAQSLVAAPSNLAYKMSGVFVILEAALQVAAVGQGGAAVKLHVTL
jgi:hypothetical protein